MNDMRNDFIIIMCGYWYLGYSAMKADFYHVFQEHESNVTFFSWSC